MEFQLTTVFKNILVIADIEGTSRCFSRDAARFNTPEWYEACIGMSRDVNAVVTALFNAGAEHIVVQDFHRTAFNLLPELIHPRAKIVHGYSTGPVFGVGDPGDAQAVMFVGLHAAAGSGPEAVLPHTLTSRIESLTMDGEPVPEIAFFASSLFRYSIKPVFFSGGPVACEQAQKTVPDITTVALDRSGGSASVDEASFHRALADGAVQALSRTDIQPYCLPCPAKLEVTFRGGTDLNKKLARRWNLPCENNTIHVAADDFQTLYWNLIKLCYLPPFGDRAPGLGLFFFHLRGRWGLFQARRHLRKHYGSEYIT